MCFLFGPMDKRNFIHFLKNLTDVNSYLKFTYESSKTSIPFLDLKVSLSILCTFPLICTSNPQIDTSFILHLVSS